MEEKIKQSHAIINKAIKKYGDIPMFVGFSGGGDSLLCANVVKNHKKTNNAKIFHANTGIGLKKTREFVRSYCRNREWELVEIRAKEDCGQDYEEIVKEHGFPGAGQHIKMYIRLKERPIRELHRRYKKEHGSKIMMFTGIRYDESQKRSGYKDNIIQVVGGVVWVNPVYWFTGQDKHDYLEQKNIEQNPVNKEIGMSGECLCGAYAHKGELDLIRLIEPETADHIEQLEKKVWDNGWHWGWEDSPHKQRILEKYGQQNMFFCNGCGKRD